MPKINEIRSRQILDSRGNPTIEVDVILNDKTSEGQQCQVGHLLEQERQWN